MLIPRYWQKAEADAFTPDGKRVSFTLWRGSADSPSEAERLAREAAARVESRIRSGQGFPDRYSYGERPLREPVIRELPGTGPDAAVITRNTYGALVLNAAGAFFIDVDVPDAPPAPPPADALAGLVGGLLGKLFGGGGGAPAPAPPQSPADAARAQLRQWVASRGDWAVRVYRTHSGLRYLVTHRPFTPGDAESESAMRALGADARYVQLCRTQKSFRARLTPKPWRAGVELPPARFPYEGGEEEEMRRWVATYGQAASAYATCTLLEEMGAGEVHPAVRPIVELHDELTRVGSGLPLA